MALDPQIAAMLAASAHYPQPNYQTLSAAELRAMLSGPSPYATGEPVESQEDIAIASPAGELRMRLYSPKAESRLPLTLYFHGGGYALCGLDTHDNVCRTLAARAQTLVLSVDYRLAPEARFPAAVDDAYLALGWALKHAEGLGADASRIAVAGDSAGGGLAALLAQSGPVCHQLLLYPLTDWSFDSESFRRYGDGYFLTTVQMQWFKAQYLIEPSHADDPRASPLRAADLSLAAPATILTAEFDPLRDQGEAYALRLREADIAVEQRCWPGQIHGFASMLGVVDAADAALAWAARGLYAGLNRRLEGVKQ